MDNLQKFNIKWKFRLQYCIEQSLDVLTLKGAWGKMLIFTFLGRLKVFLHYIGMQKKFFFIS